MAAQTQTATTIPRTSTVRPEQDKPYENPEYSFTYLNYFKDSDAAPPDQLNSALSEHELRVIRRGEESPNITRIRVQIRNIQGITDQYSIAEHGFTIGHLSSRMKNWRDDEGLKRVYFREIDELLKKETGAIWTYQYEHHVRRYPIRRLRN